MSVLYSLSIVGTVAAMLLSGEPSAHSQTQNGECRYFLETGHFVCGEFLEFYDTRGGNGIFGNPLTEAFDDPARGLLVQYFQRARMEWHPSNLDPYKVQLGLLGDELGYPLSPTPEIPAPGSTLHYYFPETGHVVSYAFLDYFRAHGGIDIFGYPRSEFMVENGAIVQYFQRICMQWSPESAPPIRLRNVGELYLERFGVPGDYDKWVPPPLPLLDECMGLDVSATVRYAIIGRRGTQTVFVYLSDQCQQPVRGAAVSMVAHYESGDQSYPFEPTNANGFTSYSFEIPSLVPGRKVVIDVNVTYDDLATATQTFFVPWP